MRAEGREGGAQGVGVGRKVSPHFRPVGGNGGRRLYGEKAGPNAEIFGGVQYFTRKGSIRVRRFCNGSVTICYRIVLDLINCPVINFYP